MGCVMARAGERVCDGRDSGGDAPAARLYSSGGGKGCAAVRAKLGARMEVEARQRWLEALAP
jgi:hypothetical protein